MVKDIRVVTNDLKIYYRGFEVALDKGNIDDAVGYLKDMGRELNDILDYLQAKKEGDNSRDIEAEP